MPRSWRALPLPSDPRVRAKAPTYSAFLDQEHDAERFRLPRDAFHEHPIAVGLIESVEDMQAIKVGEQFVLERFPQGLSVVGPSGWKFMIYFDLPKKAAVETTQVAKKPLVVAKASRKKVTT